MSLIKSLRNEANKKYIKKWRKENKEHLRKYNKEYRKKNKDKTYIKEYRKKNKHRYEKSIKRANDKYKVKHRIPHEEKLKECLNDERLWGQYRNTNEVFDNLVIPVPRINKDFIETLEIGKFSRTLKVSGYKIMYLFLMSYYADKHNRLDGLYLGTDNILQKQFSSNRYGRFFTLFLEKKAGHSSIEKEERSSNAYNFKEWVEFDFLSYRDAVKYIELLAYKKYDEVKDLVENNKVDKLNATSIRMSMLLKRGYKLKDLAVKDFCNEINACYIKQLDITTPSMSNKDFNTIKENVKGKFNKETKTNESKDNFYKINKSPEEILNKILVNYRKQLEDKKNNLKKSLKKITNSDDIIYKSLNKKILKLHNKILDVDKVLNSIIDDTIVMGEYENKNRIYNLFTQSHKELRNMIFSFMGFNYEVDLTFSNFQLLKDSEKKLFNTSILEYIYDNFEGLVDNFAKKIYEERVKKIEEYKEEIEKNFFNYLRYYNKIPKKIRIMRKKIRKELKQYFISIMNGMTSKFTPFYFKERLDELSLEGLENYGIAIEKVFIKFKNLLTDKLNDYKKIDKTVNKNNLLYYFYTGKEKKVMNELSDLLNIVTFRVHDCLYVKAPNKKYIDNKLKDFNYDVSVDKITLSFMDYL